MDIDAHMASVPTLSSLALLASTSQATDGDLSSTPHQKTKEQVRRHYVRTLHKVIDQSDIVILVLDARDPEGCRSRIVEEEVRRRESEGKKLLFVLNKIGAIYYSMLYNVMFMIMQILFLVKMLSFGFVICGTQLQLSPSARPPLHNEHTSPQQRRRPFFVFSRLTSQALLKA